jgi:hypothetical protein
LAGLVGDIGYEASIAALPAMVSAECLKDDRVSRVDVRVASAARDSVGLMSIVLELDCTLADESGTFAMTLAVSQVAVVLLEITA